MAGIKPTPPAGRAPRTAGHQRPSIVQSKTAGGGRMHERAEIAHPSNNTSGGDAGTPQGGTGS
jgi:hypothetical protein